MEVIHSGSDTVIAFLHCQIAPIRRLCLRRSRRRYMVLRLIGVDALASSGLPIIAAKLSRWCCRGFCLCWIRGSLTLGFQLLFRFQPMLRRAALGAAFTLVNALRAGGDLFVSGFLGGFRIL